MDPRVPMVLNELAARGFGKLSAALSPDLVRSFRESAAHLEREPRQDWSGVADWFERARWEPAHFGGALRNSVSFDCLGMDPGLDRAVEELLAQQPIRDLLDAALGPDYRMWFVQLRWAQPDSEEYVLHQDLYGELALCVYLSDHPDSNGSMVFWPGSQNWPRAVETELALRPACVRERLASIQGSAGDICVFLNKTWHGRTIAVDTPRLVFLISFVPSGPNEHPRRVPAATRAKLGPQLKRVTSSLAARAFGGRTPADQGFSARCEQARLEFGEECTFGGYGLRACSDFAWAWCKDQCRASDPSRALGDTLWVYKRLVTNLAVERGTPRRLAAQLVEDFALRAEQSDLSPRSTHGLRAQLALTEGNIGMAREQKELWRNADRDWLAGCEACEMDALVRMSVLLGDFEEALSLAETIVSGKLSCDRVPDVTWSLLLEPIALQRGLDQAVHAHDAGLRAVSGQLDRLDRVGFHLAFAALCPDPTRGLQVLFEHRALAVSTRSARLNWGYWSGAWLLLARLPMPAETRLTMVAPQPNRDGRLVPVEDSAAAFADQIRSHLAAIATKADIEARGKLHTQALLALEARVNEPAFRS